MSRGDTPQVFLSRTHELKDLPTEKSFVAAAVEAVNGVGGSVVDQTNFPPSDQSPVDYCRKRLAKASHYFGIIGFRYGAPVPENPDKSYVGMEFDTATTLKLQRFVFLLDENATLPMPNIFQHDPQYQKQQQKFRAWLENDSGVTIRRVGTPHELARFLTQLLLEEGQNPSHSREQYADVSASTPPDLASAAQKQLGSVLALLQSAARAMGQVEHSYVKPAEMDNWREVDDKIRKHKELAESVTSPADSLASFFEEASRGAEKARKTVGELNEKWPAKNAAELTSIIDTISDLQAISGQLIERVVSAQEELEERAAYFVYYQKPRGTLSHAYDLIDEVNANTNRMKRVLSRPHTVSGVKKKPNMPPPVERPHRDVSPSPGRERRETAVKYLQGDWKAAAGQSTPSEGRDSVAVPVPSEAVRDSGVVAVNVAGDSMEGAGIRNGDYVIVDCSQQVPQDRDIVVIGTKGVGDPEEILARVKRFREESETQRRWLESEYSNELVEELIDPDDDPFVIGKVIGIFRSMP
jgi:phage repressor protein C with HTH and peptisase S24 domain